MTAYPPTDPASVTPSIDAPIYLFTYAKSATPLGDRLAEVAARATARFGAQPAALVVPAGEIDEYLTAQEGRDEEYPLLPSRHLAAGHVGALARQ